MYSSLCSLLHPIMEEKRGSVCYECNCCYSIAKSFPTLWPHGLQHPRLPYPSLSSRVFSDSCPLNQWYYLTISPATPFSLLLSPSIFPIISVFSNELAFHLRWPQYWSFSFTNSPFNEYSGLISFRIDWFDLLAVQGTLKSFLQHRSSKASILLCSAFFMVQLSHLYMTTGKTIALTIWTFVGKVMFLLFNMSRFVIAFKGVSVFEFQCIQKPTQWFEEVEWVCPLSVLPH